MSEASPPATLDYTDQPPGSRVEFRRTEEGIVLIEQAPGAWCYLKWIPLMILVLIGLPMLSIVFVLGRTLAPGQPLPWDVLWRAASPRLPALLICYALLCLSAAALGFLRSKFEVTRDELIIHTQFVLSRIRRVPRDQIGSVRYNIRTGVNIVSITGRVLVRQFVHRKTEGRWIADTLRRELGQRRSV